MSITVELLLYVFKVTKNHEHSYGMTEHLVVAENLTMLEKIFPLDIGYEYIEKVERLGVVDAMQKDEAPANSTTTFVHFDAEGFCKENPGHITDGDSVWSAACPECGQQTMEVVRPGKVQCGNCD